MRPEFRSAMFVMYFLVALLTAQVKLLAVTVTVPSTAGPWNPTLNSPLYDYGVHDNTDPVEINGKSGISFTAGESITVSYVSGLISASAGAPCCPPVDANGQQDTLTNTSNGTNGKFPAFYMDRTVPAYLVELVGTFANKGVIVGQPFVIGNGPTKLTVPNGASQLLLGINDNLFSDNGSGSFSVTVTSGCQVSVTNWRQFTLPWGTDQYDHHYAAGRSSLSSMGGTMELRVAAPLLTGLSSFTFPVQSTFSALANQINSLRVGVFAVPGPTTGPFTNIALYNTACIGGGNCYPPFAHLLQLCHGSCDSNPNLLTPKAMHEYGCLLTALAICLHAAQVQKLNTLAGPTDFDPGELNRFMSNTENLLFPGGWFKQNADVNYRTTPSKIGANIGKAKLQFDAFGNGTDSDPTLPGAAEAAIDRALCTNGVPIIVGVKSPHTGDYPGHYVVITGKQGTATDGSEYLISDPGYPDTHTTLADYNNQFQIVGAIKDPAADLSQLTIDIAVNANIMIIDASKRRTGFDPATQQILKEIPNSTYAKSQIVNDVTGADSTGTDYSIGIQTPVQGTYQIIVTGLLPGPYTLEVHPYSQDGSEQPVLELQGIASKGSFTTFQFQYASTPGSTSTVTLVATFQSSLTDIDNSLQMNWIDNRGIANSLSQKIRAASQATGPAQRNILNAFKQEVNALSGKHIANAAVQVLLQDADSLASQNP
jgi:hypothetical protein